MKPRRLIFPVAFVIAFILGCNDSDLATDFPVILSSEIKSITSKGVEVSFTVDESKLGSIEDYGVAWSSDDKTTIVADKNSTIHGGKPTSASLLISLTYDLWPGREYYAHAFIKSAGKTFYSRQLAFKSMGSEGSIIQSITPKVVLPGDVVTVTGSNFGTDSRATTVSFKARNGTQADAEIISIEDKKIVVKYPQMFVDSAALVLSRKENLPIYSTMFVTMPVPKLKDIVTTDLCNEIKFTGEHFMAPGEPTVSINDVKVSATVTDNSITVSRLYHQPYMHVELEYSYQYYTHKGFNDLTPFPYVTSGLPELMPKSGILTLEGTNFPLCSGLSVSAYNPATHNYYNGLLEITEVTSTKLTLKTTREACNPVVVVVSYRNAEVYVSDPVLPQLPDVTSVVPDHGTFGDIVTVSGTNLEDVAMYVALGPNIYSNSIPMSIVSNDGSIVKAKIESVNDLSTMDPFPVATLPLVALKCNQTNQLNFTFELEDIVLTDFSPKTSDGTIPITITGDNFLKDPGFMVGLEDTNGHFYDLLLRNQTNTEGTTIFSPLNGGVAPGMYNVVVFYFGKRYAFPQKLQWDFP